MVGEAIDRTVLLIGKPVDQRRAGRHRPKPNNRHVRDDGGPCTQQRREAGRQPYNIAAGAEYGVKIMTPCMIERTRKAAKWSQSGFWQIGDCFQPGPLLSSNNQIRNLRAKRLCDMVEQGLALK